MSKTLVLLAALLAPAAAMSQPATPVIPLNPLSAADALAKAPKVELTNGVLKATVLLPDSVKGFYRGTRFDWAGIVSSLTYGDQEYYGLWFDRMAANVRDFAYDEGGVVAGPNTAMTGPADAYDPADPPGWKEAAPGGTFLKIGVGVLRKPKDGANYNSFQMYEFADPGVWRVKTTRGQVTFTHTVSDPASGYGYVYRKVVRLVRGKPQMEIAHSLTNTGSRPIVSNSFNHNFLTLGGAPTAAGLKITTAYPILAPSPLRDVAEVAGATLTYRRSLGAEERLSTPLKGFEAAANAYDFTVQGVAGAGYRVTGDHPVSSVTLWSIVRTVAVEPFVTLDISPGKTQAWTYRYSYTR